MKKKDDKLRVSGCFFCDALNTMHFNHPYYLSDRFVVVDWPGQECPIVIFGEHVSQINKQDWGYILQKTRDRFGFGMRLLINEGRGLPKDHWHAIVRIEKEKKW